MAHKLTSRIHQLEILTDDATNYNWHFVGQQTWSSTGKLEILTDDENGNKTTWNVKWKLAMTSLDRWHDSVSSIVDLSWNERKDNGTVVNTNTHAHPFNGPFLGQRRFYQQGKTKLDFTETRDSEWQWHQLGSMPVCTSLQTDNHARTPPLSFLQVGCPSCHPTNSVKALKAQKTNTLDDYLIPQVVKQPCSQQDDDRRTSCCSEAIKQRWWLT